MAKNSICKFICCLIIIIIYNNNNFKQKFMEFPIIEFNANIFKNNNYNNKIIKKKKICICTFGKEENKYIREFIQHYEKYGVDKIFLYDNNDATGERFESVIEEYLKSGLVEIINWRGKKKVVYRIMNDCYKKNFDKFDWLIFYELDEFIHLSNYSNIKIFLNEEKFNKCNLICLNLLCHTDNNLLFYQNKSLAERFPEITPITKKGGILLEIKCIMRGHIPGLHINNAHLCNTKYDNCNGFGHLNKHKGRYSIENDYKYYYIDHYYSKSTEEFINKINKGDAQFRSVRYALHRIDKYFSQSKFTEEKRLMIQNRTGLNLTIFKNYPTN